MSAALRALLPFVALAAIVQGGFRLWLRPAREAALAAERDRVARLDTDRQRREAVGGADERAAEAVRADLERTESQVEELRGALAQESETGEILDSLAALASEEGLRVRRFAPDPESGAETFAARSATVELEGDYFRYVAFFERVASLERTVIVDEFELLAPAEPDRPLAARFVAVTVGRGLESTGSASAP